VEVAGLERHAETCSGCRERLNGYRGLMAALRVVGTPSHVDSDRLTRFAVHRAAPNEPDYDQARLSATEVRQIEGHVSECPRCRLAFDSMIAQYNEMDCFLAEAGVPPRYRPNDLVGLRPGRSRTSRVLGEERTCPSDPIRRWRGPRCTSCFWNLARTVASRPVSRAFCLGSNRDPLCDSRLELEFKFRVRLRIKRKRTRCARRWDVPYERRPLR
jgi:hypothetical protein